MATTAEEVLSIARDFLQDTETPYRYSDESLVRYYNHALFEAKRYRPDLFINSDGVVTKITPSALSTELPIDEQFALPIAQFVTSMAELGDDEFTVQGRAVAFLTVFRESLAGA